MSTLDSVDALLAAYDEMSVAIGRPARERWEKRREVAKLNEQERDYVWQLATIGYANWRG